MDQIDDKDTVVLKPEDIAEVERLSNIFPATSTNHTETVIMHFLTHIKKVYGVDLGFITEEQYRNETGKQFDKKNRRRFKLGRKSSGDDSDYF